MISVLEEGTPDELKQSLLANLLDAPRCVSCGNSVCHLYIRESESSFYYTSDNIPLCACEHCIVGDGVTWYRRLVYDFNMAMWMTTKQRFFKWNNYPLSEGALRATWR